MIRGFAISISSAAGDRAAVADYIAAHFQQRQAPTHFLAIEVHRDGQVIMMARFYPVKQFPNGKKLWVLRSRIRARTRARTRVCMRGRARTYAREGGKFIQHILDGLHQLGAILDHLVTTYRERILDAARHAKDLPTLFGGHPCRDQGTTPLGRLDHDHAKAEAADDSVAHRKPTGERQG